MNKRALFEQYITSNINSAYRFAYTYVKDFHSAEDVVSESVIKALKSINSLKNPEYIKSWFYRIIANTSIDFLRHKKRYNYCENNDCNFSFEDDHADISFFSIVEKLDVKYREIIILRFFENMQIKEIAQILKINENTVKTRLYKALEILKIEGDLIWKSLIMLNQNI